MNMANWKHKFSPLREWEVFEAMEKNPDKADELMKEWGNTKPFNYLLSLNFSPRIKSSLPEGMPPYNRDEVTDSDFQGALVYSIERFKYCLEGSTLKPMKKEGIFIEILNSIPPKSADLLVHCKDKALHELFPSITKELVERHHPHLVK